MHNRLVILSMIYCLFSCQSSTKKNNSEKSSPILEDTVIVDFWNGNRSEIRQNHESDVLKAVLEATSGEFGPFKLQENRDEYPGDEESLSFSEKNHDIFVTIAGNQKFSGDKKIVIHKPLAKNLLGYRVPIIREKDKSKFFKTDSTQLKSLNHGIPETWSDADIFRYNNFEVSEEGNFDDIFERLANENFDYTTFGANEVKSIFENRASKVNGLTIEDELLFFYPFPLVFYVNPNKPKLAKRIEAGLKAIEDNGTLDQIFQDYYGSLVKDLNLKERRLIMLENQLIPETFSNLKPDLLEIKNCKVKSNK